MWVLAGNVLGYVDGMCVYVLFLNIGPKTHNINIFCSNVDAKHLMVHHCIF